MRRKRRDGLRDVPVPMVDSARSATRNSTARRAFYPAVALLALGLALPLLACYGPEYHSVHFRDDRPDFFEMPQPWRGAPPQERALPGAEIWLGRSFERAERNEPTVDWVKEALRREAAGRFQRAVAAWGRYQQANDEKDPEDWEYRHPPAQALALADRIAALKAWRGPQDTAALRQYLEARDLVDKVAVLRTQAAPRDVASSPDYRRIPPLLARLTREPYGTHAGYLRACLQFYMDTPEASAAAFRAFLKRHPRHALALYMIGRSYLRAILTAEKKGGAGLSPAQRARYLRQAMGAYEACAAADPHSSLAEDARGKVTACLFRQGRYAAALVHYCGQLAVLRPGEENRLAFLSARMCLRQMTLADHHAFQARVLSRPELATVYLDLHLYFTGQPGLRASYNLGLFALEVLKRHPAAPLSGRLLARLAVIEGRLGHWERAERLAAVALQRCGPGGYRDQARWEHALALRHLGRRREALAEYERLAGAAAVDTMRRGAHEAAALLSEEIGDRANAIRHYFALEYRLDYGYLIDCLASQDDLRAFLRRFPHHPRAKLVRYSLGFRQLRASQYDEAARTFASLGAWLDVAEKVCDCSTSKGKPRWPPLRTARFLAAAVRREAAGRTSEEKARAAYERAGFLFHERHLIMYNGALWNGWRTWAFDLHGPDEDFGGMTSLTPREQRQYDRYQEEHAALFQAQGVFEHIARDYPKTPEAPKALYSAALCCTFLPHLERFWSAREGEYQEKAIRLYRRLQRDYPHDPLAQAAVRYGGPLTPAPAQPARAPRRSAG
jgi:TolA-binding protein